MTKKPYWTGERLETYIFNETTIEHLHRYAVAMECTKGKKVLDIACGEGYGANLLSNEAAQVIGVDIDSNTIEKAKIKYSKKNLQFITGTVEKIPFSENQFDIIVSFETLEHIKNHDKMLLEIKRVLRPGGLLIISTPDKKNYTDKPGTKNPFHLKELYEDEFDTLLNKFFSNVKLVGQQIANTSIIRSTDSMEFKSYSGNYEQIKIDIETNPLYYIAFASDEHLPVLKNSIFNGKSIFEKGLSKKEKLVTGTITYKLGHALLYPFKLVKNLFKKQVSQE